MDDHKTQIRQRAAQMQLRILDAADAVLDQMEAARAPKLPEPPLPVRRRLLTNMLALWQFCGVSKCQRSQCCRGNPLHCLTFALPLLPPEALDGLWAPRGPRRKPRPARPADTTLPCA